MSKPTAEEILAAAERDELHSRVLEEQLDRLDPHGAPHRRRLGVEMPDFTYSDDEVGRAQFRAEIAARRASWLLGRYHELSAQAARRARYDEAAARGLDRFAGGGRSLEELLEPTRERIRKAGGLTHEHLEELGRLQDVPGGEAPER